MFATQPFSLSLYCRNTFTTKILFPLAVCGANLTCVYVTKIYLESYVASAQNSKLWQPPKMHEMSLLFFGLPFFREKLSYATIPKGALVRGSLRLIEVLHAETSEFDQTEVNYPNA